MDDRINRMAALVNVSAYGAGTTEEYLDSAVHIEHAALRRRYGQLVVQVCDKAVAHTKTPTVLDLGAGEGSVTLPFFELGAKVRRLVRWC